MGKGPTRRGHAKRDRRHALATGHRPHITGAGTHDPRPNRLRQRGAIERRAIADQRD